MFFVYLKQKLKLIIFLILLTRGTPTFNLQWRNTLPFLDVNINNGTECITSIYHKPTFTGLLTNFTSFIPYTYKLGLIKTLVNRLYNINNTWKGFDLDLKNLILNLGRNSFPSHVVDKVVKLFLDKHVAIGNNRVDNNVSVVRYFKLPYIGDYSKCTQTKIRQIIRNYCGDIDIKLVFTSFKVGNMFCNKDSIPPSLKSRVVYKFICTSCNACYIGETHRHLATRINEHLNTDRNSHIYKHITKSPHCREKCNPNSFKIIDSAPTKYLLRIKENLYIGWEKPDINKQVDGPLLSLFN